MASTVNSKLYSENTVGRLQFASIASCRTLFVEIFSVMFAWCSLLHRGLIGYEGAKPLHDATPNMAVNRGVACNYQTQDSSQND
jgi:hypothetical protein